METKWKSQNIALLFAFNIRPALRKFKQKTALFIFFTKNSMLRTYSFHATCLSTFHNQIYGRNCNHSNQKCSQFQFHFYSMESVARQQCNNACSHINFFETRFWRLCFVAIISLTKIHSQWLNYVNKLE